MEVSRAGKIRRPGRYIQFGSKMSAGEVRPEFKERHMLSTLKGNRCQRTDVELFIVFLLLFSK